jgi:hypothetical protein
MSTQAHDSSKAVSNTTATPRSSQFQTRPFDEASVNSAFTPVTNQFQSRPFAAPVPSQQSQSQQAAPDIQAQLEQAKRFNYDLSEINLFSTGTTPPEARYSSVIQPKLAIGQPGDKYEQEADQVAAEVMSMSVAPEPSPQVQRLEEEDSSVQRWSLTQSITPVVQRQVDEQVQRAFQAGGNEASGDLESRLKAFSGGGNALAPEVRAFMEPRFGADFSSVRVHTGGEAVQMNRELGAQAFAHGSDVYFGAGKSPGNNELTAHELTHVVQQTSAASKNLVSKEEDPSGTQNQTQDNPDEQIMVVQEEFEPEDSGIVPDQDWYIPTVNSDDGLDQQAEDNNLVAAPSVGFIDGGRIGTARYGDSLPEGDNCFPQAFADGGQTGTVVWAGGGGAGAHGNEAAGSVQTHIPPTFSAQTLSPTDADAWVKIGTARLDVTRSWVGINSGNQGNGHFVTSKAAARINQHETLHVANTRSNYKAHIEPLLNRVGEFYAGVKTQHAPTQAAAITALQNYIRWAGSVTAFQNADRAANQPGGTVDSADLKSGTYPVDAGPGKVGGVNFQHRVRLPSEPNPV